MRLSDVRSRKPKALYLNHSIPPSLIGAVTRCSNRLLEATTCAGNQALTWQSEDASGAPLSRKQRSTISGCVTRWPPTRQCARMDQTPIPCDLSQTATVVLVAVGGPRSLESVDRVPTASLSGEGNGGMSVQTTTPITTAAVLTSAARRVMASNDEVERRALSQTEATIIQSFDPSGLHRNCDTSLQPVVRGQAAGRRSAETVALLAPGLQASVRCSHNNQHPAQPSCRAHLRKG
jgi:hypothetical protein